MPGERLREVQLVEFRRPPSCRLGFVAVESTGELTQCRHCGVRWSVRRDGLQHGMLRSNADVDQKAVEQQFVVLAILRMRRIERVQQTMQFPFPGTSRLLPRLTFEAIEFAQDSD